MLFLLTLPKSTVKSSFLEDVNLPFASINQCQIYYEVLGEGDPLILVAGYSCDHSYFEPIVEILLANRLKLILFDNRYAGRTQCQDQALTIDDLANDTAALMENLNIKSAYVLGHSMGGAIVQALAYHFPHRVKKAVLAHSLVKSLPITEAVLQFPIDLAEEGISMRRRCEIVMPWLFSNEFLMSAEKREAFIQSNEQDPYPMSVLGLKRQREAILHFDSFPWVKQIKVPSLVLASDEDLLCPAKECRKLAEAIPQAQFHLFAHQAHLTHIEKPEEFCRAVLNFLSRS